MTNLEIRETLRTRKIRYWQLADAVGVSPYSLSVWLRHDLTGDRLTRVSNALDSLLNPNQQTEESVNQ